MTPNGLLFESILKNEGFRCSPALYDDSVLLFEDESIMGFIRFFENAEDLLRSWRAEQARFMAKMAIPLRQAARKSWNCYAILISRDAVPAALRADFLSLEEDLTLMRKLVGESTFASEDAERVLMPVLAIRHNLSTPQIEEESPVSRLTGWSEEAKRLLESDSSSPTELVEALMGDRS